MNYEKTIIFPVFSWNVHRLEKRLKTESSEGFRLAAGKGWKLYFDKAIAKERDYFVYESPLLAKPDRFLAEYFSIENAYHLRKSPLKRDNRLFFNIFEVDERKKDDLFQYIYQSRDHFYFGYYTKALIVNSVFCAVTATLEMIPSAKEPALFVFLILACIFILKNLFCVLFFGFRMNAYKKP